MWLSGGSFINPKKSKIYKYSVSKSNQAATNFLVSENNISAVARVSNHFANDLEQNQKQLVIEIRPRIFLLRQGLSLRRENESNDNLY